MRIQILFPSHIVFNNTITFPRSNVHQFHFFLNHSYALGLLKNCTSMSQASVMNTIGGCNQVSLLISLTNFQPGKIFGS